MLNTFFQLIFFLDPTNKILLFINMNHFSNSNQLALGNGLHLLVIDFNSRVGKYLTLKWGLVISGRYVTWEARVSKGTIAQWIWFIRMLSLSWERLRNVWFGPGTKMSVVKFIQVFIARFWMSVWAFSELSTADVQRIDWWPLDEKTKYGYMHWNSGVNPSIGWKTPLWADFLVLGFG